MTAFTVRSETWILSWRSKMEVCHWLFGWNVRAGGEASAKAILSELRGRTSRIWRLYESIFVLSVAAAVASVYCFCWLLWRSASGSPVYNVQRPAMMICFCTGFLIHTDVQLQIHVKITWRLFTEDRITVFTSVFCIW